jgi:hypothetical protein
MFAYARYIGIDYSGAETPSASLKGLHVYLAEGDAPPVEVAPPPVCYLRVHRDIAAQNTFKKMAFQML